MCTHPLSLGLTLSNMNASQEQTMFSALSSRALSFLWKQSSKVSSLLNSTKKQSSKFCAFWIINEQIIIIFCLLMDNFIFKQSLMSGRFQRTTNVFPLSI